MKLWNKISPYIKTNVFGILLAVIAFVVLSIWLLPKEKQNDKEISGKYDQIAKSYNEKSGDYKNVEDVVKLQSEVQQIKSDGQLTKLLKVAFISSVLVALTGFLGNALQYIFTVLQFTKLVKDGVTGDLTKVLSAALFSAALIVCFVFAMVFWV
ncbi:MAG: hypothetical protein RDU14_16680 [Melioribacteraceae bacterium]|nr:hypothetical protein [Melioribacteraceae bacterium]